MQETGDLHSRTVFAVLLIGMSLLSFTPQNVARTAKSTKTQSGSFLSMYDNVTTHEGDLIIDGTQTFVIENCTYNQTGNIYVKDSGNLSLQNAALILSMQYNDQYNIYIEENATLTIDNSTLNALQWFGSFSLNGRAQAIVKHSTFNNVGITSYQNSNVTIENSTLPLLNFWDAGKVMIENSTLADIVLHFYFPHVVILDGLYAGYHENWNLHNNQSVQNVLQDLTVKNSVVAWSLTIHDDAIVTASNCEVEAMRILLYHTADVKDISPGYHTKWAFDSIVLSNSTVRDHWYMGVYDTAVSITNSSLRIRAYGHSTISLTKSSIASFTTNQTSSITITFDATVLTSHLAIIDSDVHIDGNVTFSLQTLSVASSNVTRNYNIVVKDMNDYPANSADIALFDKNNTIVWNGTTNSLGQANFNLTFTDNNYTDTLRLEAVNGNLSGAQNVSFLSDTPIIVELGLHDDATTNAEPLKTVVGQGFSVHINVALVNRGNFTETFNVTVYANDTQVETQPVTLENGTSKTMTFTWNTTRFAYGNYTVSAVADTVPNEADTTNNNCTCNVAVHVGVPGDVSGPIQGEPDGKCGMRDISWIILHFNGKPCDTRWLANTDINNDNVTNMRDISIAILNFNKHE